jgi:GR25 family glycosyltransferase involved in LPS biosynthesis
MFIKQFLCILVSVIIVYFSIYIFHSIKTIKDKTLHTKCFVINLTKNSERLQRFYYFYNKSDISSIPLERFNAINGRDIDAEKYITTTAYENLLINERNNYRTRHYQLTRGAIGCYLSHTMLFKKLLDDAANEYYIIFEDDAAILPEVIDKLHLAIQYAPSDWDIILLAPIMEVVAENTPLFKKYDTFWGLCGYIINKRGAEKFMEEYYRKAISMQIDSKMSYMILKGMLNVYGYRTKLLWHDRTMGTDIQMPLRKVSNINPFFIEDL